MTTTAANPSPKFEQALGERLGEQTRAQLRKRRWEGRLTSLWAPVTVFGLAFVVYLFIVELNTPSYHWAQPLLKGFGLLMLAWFVGLLVLRNVVRSFSEQRKLRHQAFEFLGEIASLADKHREKVTGRPYEELLTSSVALAQQIAGSAPGAATGQGTATLEAQLKESTAVADKHLAAWRKQSAFDFGMGFVKAFAIAMIIRSVLIEPFRIPSGSMIPTLEIGDQIFVNKFIYGVRIPGTNFVPFVIVRRPERGDVIVFENPLDSSRDYIKRVIGLPGDEVEMRDHVVYINGQAQPSELVTRDYVYYDDQTGQWQAEQASLFRETLDGRVHQTAQVPWGKANFPKLKVPEGEVFVMGDNRDRSADSRYGFGVDEGRVAFVPYGHIKGKAMVIWLATGHGGLFSGLFGGTGLQTRRFFLPVR